MKLKRRMITNRAISLVLGTLIIVVGLIKNNEIFVPMGVAMVFCTVLQLVRQWKFLTNPDKLKELENTYKDERVIFIAQKSYSFAFWVSVYSEFVGVLVTMYLGMEEIGSLLGAIVCLQVLVYAVANIFYSKKF